MFCLLPERTKIQAVPWFLSHESGQTPAPGQSLSCPMPSICPWFLDLLRKWFQVLSNRKHGHIVSTGYARYALPALRKQSHWVFPLLLPLCPLLPLLFLLLFCLFLLPPPSIFFVLDMDEARSSQRWPFGPLAVGAHAGWTADGRVL